MNARDATASRKSRAAFSCAGDRSGAQKSGSGLPPGVSGGRAIASSAPSSMSASTTPVETPARRASSLFEAESSPGSAASTRARAGVGRFGDAPVARTAMRRGWSSAPSAGRVAMRRTMPRGAMVQAAIQSSRARNFAASGGRSSRSMTGLSLSDGPRRRAQTTPIRAREPSETLTKSPSATSHSVRNAIGIGLVHRDRDQHVGELGAIFRVTLAHPVAPGVGRGV